MKVADLEKLLAAATPGRWASTIDPDEDAGIDSFEDCDEDSHWVVEDGLSSADANAIVALRNIAPELIAIAKAVAESGYEWGEDALTVGCWICGEYIDCVPNGPRGEAIEHRTGCIWVLSQRLVNG